MTNDSSQLPEIRFDRSRVDTWQECPRKRWWLYEHGGTGIERPGEWLDPLIGTAVHEGIEHLLIPTTTTSISILVNDAVAIAKEVILSAQRRGPILVYKPSNDPDKDIEEALYLAEALVRGWAAVRLSMLRQWEIIAVEREMDAQFSRSGRQLRLMTRADIVHHRPDDRSLFIRNLKTTSKVDQRFRDKWRYDMQTLSEALAVEATLGKQVDGVIIEGLIKGSREDYERDLNEWTGPGKFHWNTPLLWAWKRDGEPPMTDDRWYAKYTWRCTGPHEASRGKSCPGNVEHRLSGVHKAPTWTFPGGVAAWIDMLARNEREVLEAQFIELTPILRSAYEIERWKGMTLPCEVAIREHREYLMETSHLGDTEYLLDHWFPMHTQGGRCVFPSKCECFDLCHGNQADDLEGNGWQPRRANHPQEFAMSGEQEERII